MAKLDVSSKKLILDLEWCVSEIVQKLKVDYHLDFSCQSVACFLITYERSESFCLKPGYGRLSRTTDEVEMIVQAKMQADDETTATQLQDLLKKSGILLSLTTIKKCRLTFGWTFHGYRYCQLIRNQNKDKGLQFVFKCQAEADRFDDVIWSDETSVQLESHR